MWKKKKFNLLTQKKKKKKGKESLHSSNIGGFKSCTVVAKKDNIVQLEMKRKPLKPVQKKKKKKVALLIVIRLIMVHFFDV